MAVLRMKELQGPIYEAMLAQEKSRADDSGVDYESFVPISAQDQLRREAILMSRRMVTEQLTSDVIDPRSRRPILALTSFFTPPTLDCPEL
jgi:hypothetical protein